MPIVEGGFNIPLPRMVKVRQRFRADRVEDVEGTLRRELAKKEIEARIKPGQKIVIAVGSRGIAKIHDIVRVIVRRLQELGARPFIVPAMGSHGGATAGGQMQVLASYNITEDAMGVPIRSSMETVQIGTSQLGVPVYIDKIAYESDGIVVINRVKVHTCFRGPVESGLMKMLAIGLGKHRGATCIHRLGFHRFHELIPDISRTIIAKAPIAFGVAIVENAYGEPMVIRAVTPDRFEATDSELLEVSKHAMARILFEQIHVLIIDEIGKNISGDGMDPNITGRFMPRFMMKMDHKPVVDKIVVLGLTEETHGNACGIGHADVTTRRLVDRIDYESTYANAITSTELGLAKIPLTVENDRQAVAVALLSVNGVEPEKAKVVRVKNTLALTEIYISEALLEEARGQDNIEVIGDLKPMEFDENDNLVWR